MGQSRNCNKPNPFLPHLCCKKGAAELALQSGTAASASTEEIRQCTCLARQIPSLHQRQY